MGFAPDTNGYASNIQVGDQYDSDQYDAEGDYYDERTPRACPYRKEEVTVTVANTQGGGSPVQRGSSGSLADVVEMILDKGLVIDVFVRVSLVGIELITIDARIVVASVDTYLRFAEATNRLDLHQKGGKDLPQMMEGMTQSGAQGKTKGVLDAAKNKVDEFRGGDDEEEREKQPARPRRPRNRERES
ncbi:gas vesicle protein GvpJ [Parasphingorhabdus pacifica]